MSPVQTGDLCKGLVTQLLQHHAINRFRAHTVQVHAPASAGSKHTEQLRACIAFDVNEGGTALVFRKYRLLHKMLAELPEHLNHLPVSAAIRASLSLLATVLLLLLTHSFVCPPPHSQDELFDSIVVSLCALLRARAPVSAVSSLSRA